MNEAETRAELIDPALLAVGWGVVEGSKVQRERQCEITLGRLIGGGRRTKAEIADYILVYRNRRLAVIEAKRKDLSASEGVGQAKLYAEKLQLRFTYATNGESIYQIDRETGKEGDITTFPTPDELWRMTYPEQLTWRERFAEIPFEDRSGKWQPRYYQDLAIQKTLDVVAEGQQRILLTLATGTGKTAIAFQLAWKLFHARWNLGREPTRRPRILFLADRNILADQAFNSFSAFPEDALKRISPDEVRKHGHVPKNGSIFFTIFQTFMSGINYQTKLPEPNFGAYPPDFFDFIIIDECHRGGANDEGNWRGILEYFAPAVQLGLTATPKRDKNADTYEYFGEPLYTYALKEGINDGFLTPFRVVQIQTTIDDYVYTSDDEIADGEAEEGKLYEESDFNRIIEIKEREAKRVDLFMEQINQDEKTIVFCATQNHAAAVRDLINQRKTSKHPDYCARVTANDGKIGETHLANFQDTEKSIPTILTTSQKLSTGVDAREVRNIVLMRPVNSMIEFKQIIGRGTRLYEGKDYFTVYDFVKAYHHFNDATWDGEPLEPEPTLPPIGGEGEEPKEPGEAPEPGEGRRILKITLADGKARQIQHMAQTTFWGAGGKPLSSQEFLEKLYGDIPTFFGSEEELREIWSHPDTRKKLLDGLAEKGYGGTQLEELRTLVEGEESDLYDVLAHIAYAHSLVTRENRATTHRDLIFSHYEDRHQAFLDFVLTQYVASGITELDSANLSNILTLKYSGLNEAFAELGDAKSVRTTFVDFQRYLFHEIA